MKKIQKNQKKIDDKDEKKGINIIPLLMHLLKKAWIIILVGAIMGAMTLLFVKLFVSPTYRCSFTAYVNNQHATASKDMLTASDLNAAKELVLTYTTIMTSNSIMASADEVLDTSYSVKQLKSMVRTEIKDDTEIIQVYVIAKSPEESYRIANAIAYVSPKIMSNIVEGSSMKIVDYPQVPDGIYKPNYVRFTLLGFGAGVLITIIVLIILYLRNDIITEESELESEFSFPVLGVIPDVNSTTGGKTGYYYEYYYQENDKGEQDSEKA